MKAVLRILGGEVLGLDSDEYRIQRMSDALFPADWLSQKNESDPNGRTNRESAADVSIPVRRVKPRLLTVHWQAFDLRFGYTRRPTVYGPLAQMIAVATHHVSNASLAKINKDVPAITILTGDKDNLVNPGNSTHLARQMKRASLTKFKGAGHVVTAQ